MKKDSSVNQITEGVIWKQLLLFFFPIISFLFVTAAYSRSKKFLIIVTAYFVGILSVMTFAIISDGLNSILLGIFIFK